MYFSFIRGTQSAGQQETVSIFSNIEGLAKPNAAVFLCPLSPSQCRNIYYLACPERVWQMDEIARKTGMPLSPTLPQWKKKYDVFFFFSNKDF